MSTGSDRPTTQRTRTQKHFTIDIIIIVAQSRSSLPRHTLVNIYAKEWIRKKKALLAADQWTKLHGWYEHEETPIYEWVTKKSCKECEERRRIMKVM